MQDKYCQMNKFIHNRIIVVLIFTALKHSPSKKGKKDSALRRISNLKQVTPGNATSSALVDGGKSETMSDDVNDVKEKVAAINVAASDDKEEATPPSSQNGNIWLLPSYV